MLPDFKALVFTHTYGLDSKVRQMFSKNRSVQMFGEDERLQKHKSLAWAKGKNWRWMVILLSVVKHTSEDDVVVVNVTQHWGIERATRFIHSDATTLSHTRYSLPSLRSARKHTKTHKNATSKKSTSQLTKAVSRDSARGVAARQQSCHLVCIYGNSARLPGNPMAIN